LHSLLETTLDNWPLLSKQTLSLDLAAHGLARRFVQSKSVMLATRMLAVAIIRISEPSKLLKTLNIGTLTVPEHPIVIVFQPKRN
jgi:hypothetical protein